MSFATHLRDGAGNHVADVFVEVSDGGIRLDGQAGLLGHFPFQRVLQWAVTEPECFTFTVITEEGRRDVTLWSEAETIQALLRAVEDTVQRLVAIKRAQKQQGSKGKATFKNMVDGIVGAKHAVNGMSPNASSSAGAGGGLFSPTTRPGTMNGAGASSSSRAVPRPAAYASPPVSPRQMSPRQTQQPRSPQAPMMMQPPMSQQQQPRSPQGPMMQRAPMPPQQQQQQQQQMRRGPQPMMPPPQQQRPLSFHGAATTAQAAQTFMHRPGQPRSPIHGTRGPMPPPQMRPAFAGTPMMQRPPMVDDMSHASPAVASLAAQQQLEASLVQSKQYSDRMRAALTVREQELMESRRREEDAMRAANEAVQAQRNLDLTLKEMQRMFAAKEGQIQKLEQQHKQVQAAIALSAGAGFSGDSTNTLKDVQNEYRQLKAEISKLADMTTRVASGSGGTSNAASLGGSGEAGGNHADVDTLRGEMLDLSSQLVLEETRSRQAMDELNKVSKRLKEQTQKAETLEKETTSLTEKLEAKTSELRSKERQLLAYEESMVTNLGSIGGGGDASDKENVMNANGGGIGGGGDAKSPLGQLKALMGEAYLLKMALKKQQAEDGSSTNGAATKDISAALDAWIYASHNLKKVCFENGTFGAFTKSKP